MLITGKMGKLCKSVFLSSNRWKLFRRPLGFLINLAFFFGEGDAISCYQCATDREPRDLDGCGSGGRFHPEEHAMVDCGSEDATSPGTMCLKYVQLSPRSFIWDKRWKSVIRRCAQVSTHGQLQGCDWGYDSRGSYWEQCYCTSHGCNEGHSAHSSKSYASSLISLLFLVQLGLY